MVTTAVSKSAFSAFAPMSAQRLLVFGGIALIAGGMLFGDIFAVFVLHQNGGRTGDLGGVARGRHCVSSGMFL